MKRIALLPLALLAACSSGPSKQDSARIYAAASSAMSGARVQAVTQAQGGVAPADLTVNYSGACSLGGTLGLTGTSSADTTAQSATFSLTATFASCHEAAGTMDGNLAWSSSSSATGTTMSMVGDLDFDDGSNTASCEINVQMSVGANGFSYTGTVCGYDVTTDLDLGQ